MKNIQAVVKKNNNLVSANAGDEKNFTPAAQKKKKKKKKKINLIECFKKSLHLKHYSNSTFLLKNKEPYVLLFEGKKT